MDEIGKSAVETRLFSGYIYPKQHTVNIDSLQVTKRGDQEVGLGNLDRGGQAVDIWD